MSDTPSSRRSKSARKNIQIISIGKSMQGLFVYIKIKRFKDRCWKGCENLLNRKIQHIRIKGPYLRISNKARVIELDIGKPCRKNVIQITFIPVKVRRFI